MRQLLPDGRASKLGAAVRDAAEDEPAAELAEHVSRAAAGFEQRKPDALDTPGVRR